MLRVKTGLAVCVNICSKVFLVFLIWEGLMPESAPLKMSVSPQLHLKPLQGWPTSTRSWNEVYLAWVPLHPQQPPGNSWQVSAQLLTPPPPSPPGLQQAPDGRAVLKFTAAGDRTLSWVAVLSLYGDKISLKLFHLNTNCDTESTPTDSRLHFIGLKMKLNAKV